MKCSNGGCTREVYRGIFCFRCWAGVKWTSICQRVANKNGNNPCYEGVHIGFTQRELIQWILDNPPPKELEIPSIDRIVNEKGYTIENIQWLERDINSRWCQKDVPVGKYRCFKCKTIYELNSNNFHRNKSTHNGFNTYCKKCRKKHD